MQQFQPSVIMHISVIIDMMQLSCILYISVIMYLMLGIVNNVEIDAATLFHNDVSNNDST